MAEFGRARDEMRDLVLLIVGFGCFAGFVFLLVSSFAGASAGASAGADAGVGSWSLKVTADSLLLPYALGEVAMFLALAAMGWSRRFAMGPIALALAALCSAAVTLISAFDLPAPASITLAAVGGISTAVLAYAWMLVLSRFDMRKASVAVLLGFTLACLIAQSAPLLGAELAVDVTAITAIVAAAAVALLDPKLESCKPDGALDAKEVAKVPWLTVALLVACEFLAATMCGVAGSSTQMFAWRPGSLVFEIAFAITLLATVAVMFQSRSWTSVVWAPFLALFVVATTLALAPFTEAIELSSGLMTAAMMCGELLLWLIVPPLFSALKVPRAFLAGVLLACAGTPLAFVAGGAIGEVLPVGTLDLAGVAGSFAVVVSALFAVTFVANRSRFDTAGVTFQANQTNTVAATSEAGSATSEAGSATEAAAEKPQPEAVNPADALKTRLDGLAEKHGLTPRETEVALYTVQGFSCAYIAERLVVSSSTVRFHQQNIYRKFDVHSRNELIDAALGQP